MESHGGARAHDAAPCGCRTVRGERRADSSVMLASGGIHVMLAWLFDWPTGRQVPQRRLPTFADGNVSAGFFYGLFY